jgi:hypothetical protein
MEFIEGDGNGKREERVLPNCCRWKRSGRHALGGGDSWEDSAVPRHGGDDWEAWTE